MKRAVDAGYWILYRYDPRKEKPLTIDSKAPTMAYEDFLDGEVRYSALKRTFPENAAKYFAEERAKPPNATEDTNTWKKAKNRSTNRRKTEKDKQREAPLQRGAFGGLLLI